MCADSCQNYARSKKIVVGQKVFFQADVFMLRNKGQVLENERKYFNGFETM